MKSITIAGRIGLDAVTRETQSGNVTSWTVAVNDGFGQNKSTLWFDCSMWGVRGDKIARFLTTGTPVTVSGDLGKREHKGKTYLSIRVNDVTLQGRANDPRDAPENAAQAPAQTAMDDEIPF